MRAMGWKAGLIGLLCVVMVAGVGVGVAKADTSDFREFIGAIFKGQVIVGRGGAINYATGDGSLYVKDTLEVDGTAKIGDSSGDTLTVKSAATFNGPTTLSTGANATTISATAATAGAGLRVGASRVINTSKSVSAVDCSGSGISATVTQLLDGGVFTCATSQTLTLPSAQGASGIVQNLPGTPSVGDQFQFITAENHASNTLTVSAGTGITIYGIATTTNGSRTWNCRVTSVTANSETITCY